MATLQRVGIVMSGGGTKLFAHIGFLEALDNAGLLNDRVSAVVGTSAGSVAGGFYALGYTPQETWKTLYWNAFGYDPPSDDGRNWRSDARKRPLERFIDIDFSNFERALTQNVSYFKGFDSGKLMEQMLKKYLSPQDPVGNFLGTIPPDQRKPFYAIGLNISNRREAIFHFEAHTQLPAELEAAAALVMPAPGREAYYEYYHDLDHLTDPIENQMQVWESVRCSICIPVVFQPYLKRGLSVVVVGNDQPKPIRQTAYYTDGGARDNYSLSTAIKLAKCDAVFGQYVGPTEYPFEVMGHGNVIDVFNRNLDAMFQVGFEADQDDGEIYVRPVRTIAPILHVRPDVTFDISDMGGLKEAGYAAAAYHLWKCSEVADDPKDFLVSLLDGKVKLDWDIVFRSPVSEWGTAGPGRQALAPKESDYFIISPSSEFANMARRVFEDRYGAPDETGFQLVATPAGLKEELEKRNRERREVEPHELDQPVFQGSFQETQREMVKWGKILAWLSASGMLALLFTFFWSAGWLIGVLLDVLETPSTQVLLLGQLVLLIAALVAGGALYRWGVGLAWTRFRKEIANRIGV